MVLISEINQSIVTCRANNAKTMRQNIVRVITSANCLNECKSALIIVFRPGIIETVFKARRTRNVRKPARFPTSRSKEIEPN